MDGRAGARHEGRPVRHAHLRELVARRRHGRMDRRRRGGVPREGSRVRERPRPAGDAARHAARARAGVAAVRRIALCAQPGGRAARHVGELRGWRDGARGRVTRERGGPRLEATFEPTFEPTLCASAE
ncbi:hypothetical protein BVI434_180019 [Burkholderia vietnamiensis]|nr:hypothetical protein BVI434_180019 [Burkholderia vietnamiensis]